MPSIDEGLFAETWSKQEDVPLKERSKIAKKNGQKLRKRIINLNPLLCEVWNIRYPLFCIILVLTWLTRPSRKFHPIIRGVFVAGR